MIDSCSSTARRASDSVVIRERSCISSIADALPARVESGRAGQPALHLAHFAHDDVHRVGVRDDLALEVLLDAHLHPGPTPSPALLRSTHERGSGDGWAGAQSPISDLPTALGQAASALLWLVDKIAYVGLRR